MKTIVVIDDDPLILESTLSILARAGYRGVGAGTGVEGVGLARREQPALVIIDLNLPYISGVQVARHLQEDPATRGIPYLFLSGLLEPEEERALQGVLGGVNFLAKPCGAAKLLEEVARLAR